MYRAIIFDFFDVIHSDPFKRWLKKYGYKQKGEFEESSRLVDIGHISEQEFYRQLSDLSGQTVESIEAVFGDKQLIDQEMVDLIEVLGRHYKIGLLSNSSGEYLRPILQSYDIARFFDEIVVSAEIGMIKPRPEIFEHILEKMNLKAGEAIFIDDNPHNVAAAASLGIYSIVFTGEKALGSELAKLGIRIK